MQVTVDPAVGVAKLYIGNTLALNGTGLNTRNTSNSFFQKLNIHGLNGIGSFDSFHFWDLSAGDVTAFPYGEHIIDSQLPNGVGSNTTWTRGGNNTGNNYSQVNEANADDDTTYVITNTPNNIDSYGFAPLVETTGNIGTIAVNTIDRYDDAGPHVFDHFVKSGVSTALSAGVSGTASYNNHQSFFGTDPATGIAWTVAGRNSMEGGFKFIS